jgi:3-mercaptopyruvate sulfurtransferase SseA
MKKQNSKKTLFTLVVGMALVATILSACAPTTSQTGESPAVGDPGEVRRITLEESKAAFDNGEAVFLDVRSASSYGASHIPGASSIPLAELQSRIGELDSNQWIITYCT